MQKSFRRISKRFISGGEKSLATLKTTTNNQQSAMQFYDCNYWHFNFDKSKQNRNIAV